MPEDAPRGEAAFTLEEGLASRAVRSMAERVDELALDYAQLQRERPLFLPGQLDLWLEVARGVLRVRAALERAGPETVVIWRRGEGGAGGSAAPEDLPGLRLLCRDPSGVLGPFFGQLAGSICLSATLSPTSFYRSLLGLDPDRVEELACPSPFPPENRRVLVVAGVSTLWRHRVRDRLATAALISEVIAAVPGNLAIYFPSFAMLEDIAPLLDRGDRPLLRQGRRSSEAERAEIVDTLLRGEGHVLLAVLGGIFAEGVDLPGGALLAAVVVGPALPAATLERRLLQEWYQERYEQGFRYAWLVPGMCKVVQAAGRVLRTPVDRGAIVLIDQRFVQDEYRAFFPSEWEPRRSRRPGEDLEGTWG